MKLNSLSSAIALAFGSAALVSLPGYAIADTLTATYYNIDDYSYQTITDTGPVLSYGTAPTLSASNLVDYGVSHAGYAGNIANGTMSAYAISGNHGFGPSDTAITYSATVTNNTSSAQNYTFNFTTGGGALESATFPYDPDPGNEPMQAQISAIIAVNGNTAWSSSATLNGLPSGWTLNTTGDAFTQSTQTTGSTYVAGPSLFETVSFASYSGSVDLGMLAAGESKSLTYTLDAHTLTPVLAQDLNYNGYFYGGGIAEIGDPFGLQSSGGTGGAAFQVALASGVSAVPEAETAELMGAGLMMMGALTLRKKKKSS
jgi:hypothetical protein